MTDDSKKQYTLRDVINSRSKKKRYIDKIDIWVYLCGKTAVKFLTLVFLKLRLSANLATLISTVIGFIGSFTVILSNSDFTTLTGLTILNFWIVFDCIDGNIARTTHTSSLLGEYLDGVSGYCYIALLYTSLGVNVYRHYSLILSNQNYSWIYILIGALASMACIFPRLVEHKAKTMFSSFSSGLTDKTSYNWFYILGLNIAGMAGLSNPLMLVFFALHKLNYYLIIYFIIQSGIALISIWKTLKRVFIVSHEVN